MKRLLAAAVLVLPGLVVTGAAAPAAAHGECDDPADVPILVDYGPLEAERQVLCAPDAADSTALAALADAGLDIEGTAEYGDSVVCRVNGQPDAQAEPCDAMPAADAYWGFYLGQDGTWDYASSGVDQQVLAEGDFVALAFGDGSELPQIAPDEDLRADAHPADEADASDEAAGSDEEGDDTGLIVGAVVALVVIAAAAAVLIRRTRS